MFILKYNYIIYINYKTEQGSCIRRHNSRRGRVRMVSQPGDIIRAICLIAMKDLPRQFMVTTQRHTVGRVLREAALVTVSLVAFAFAAINSQAGPDARQQLFSNRNQLQGVRIADPSAGASGANPTSPSPAQLLASRNPERRTISPA